MRQFYVSEVLFWKEVIFSRLVDHTKLLVLLSLVILNELVNLTDLKGGRVAIVANTDDKSLYSSLGHDR